MATNWIVFCILEIAILFVTYLYIKHIVINDQYGTMIEPHMHLKKGFIINIPVHITAWSKYEFSFTNGVTELKGLASPHPIVPITYYHLDDELSSGNWLFKGDTECNIELEASKPMALKYLRGTSDKIVEYSNALTIFLFLSVINVLISFLIF
ncbi:MAG: hypothetical protein HZC02_05285 [Candidatus Levybacteria bacterium]|nr:hypothetical protein [Candidatus Levybacteria bacterium]